MPSNFGETHVRIDSERHDRDITLPGNRGPDRDIVDGSFYATDQTREKQRIKTLTSLNATKLPHGTAGGIEMNTDSKRKIHKGYYDRAQRARRRLEETLDEALKDTFPASDPVSIAVPTTRQT